MTWKPGRRRSFTAIGVVTAVLALATLATNAQQPRQFRLAQPVDPLDGVTRQVDKSQLGQAAAEARTGSGTVSVIVRFTDPSVAAYQGGIPGLPATSPRVRGERRLNVRSPESQAYLQHLASRQQAFGARLRTEMPAARVVHQYLALINGAAVVLPRNEVDRLRQMPDVVAVLPDTLQQVDTDVSPGFIGAPAAWAQAGGPGNAGEGVVVGMLDTGIWPEHPSFSDPDPAGKPYPAWAGPALPCDFGNAAHNPSDAPFTCNNKLVGARTYLATYKALVGLQPKEFDSARDSEGHGTHTTSTAAGNRRVVSSLFGRSFGNISGIAPRAHVIMYRVCGEQGCYASDSAAAVDQAVLDGVDVINFSIGGGTDPASDVVSLAFLDAFAAGVFVATSAGNSGPGADTVGHREPWTTTVAASTTNRQFQGGLYVMADNGDDVTFEGVSVTPDSPDTPAYVPVIFPPAGNELCTSPLAPGSATNTIVICRRGVNARVEKGFNVLQGGAVGMALYNPTVQELSADNHFLPAVHLDNTQGTELLAFMATHAGVTGRILGGAAETAQGDVTAAFSSRGGKGQTLGISKPDITAPGVQILAGHSPMPSAIVGGPPGELFQAIQGTSMSSPHIAGAAALLKDLHPTWSPAQIKSAIMTTAFTTVKKEDGVTPAGPFDYGSGRVDLTKAADPGLTFDETAADFVANYGQLWNSNYPSLYVPQLLGILTVERTVHNERGVARNWKTRVLAEEGLVVGVPRALNVPGGGDKTFSITVDGRGIPIGEVRHAVLELWRPDEATLRFPITVVRTTSAQIPLTKTCTPLWLQNGETTDCTITMANTSFEPVAIDLLDRLPSKLELNRPSVTNATGIGNRVVWSGVLAGAEPPAPEVGPGGSPAGGYLPLSLFGVGPIAGVGDETIVNFNVPAFVYGSRVYTRIGFVSNGYLVVGGGSGADVRFINQDLPDPARPNNVLAPFWTDLNPAFGGAMRAAILSDDVDSWLVLEWEGVREYSSPKTNSFQVWIGINGVEDISYAYGTLNGNGDLGFLTVGAENLFGNRGDNYYVDGVGTLPSLGTQLRVTSLPPAPGETRTITFSALARSFGKWRNCAEMASSAFPGIQAACVSGEITTW